MAGNKADQLGWTHDHAFLMGGLQRLVWICNCCQSSVPPCVTCAFVHMLHVCVYLLAWIGSKFITLLHACVISDLQATWAHWSVGQILVVYIYYYCHWWVILGISME